MDAHEAVRWLQHRTVSTLYEALTQPGSRWSAKGPAPAPTPTSWSTGPTGRALASTSARRGSSSSPASSIRTP